ncbi:PTS system cellobiose-specific IIA component [Streptococcus rupicaprae]|uniref:PTS system cellobiose-specific IIA component n=1 Tax=Streptococcus rupicaprae TaxID=759619 RepID=A0ABV2FH55_9STRE
MNLETRRRTCHLWIPCKLAKTDDFERAQELIDEGDYLFLVGHHAHAELIEKEANQEAVEIKLLLMHAEDQLMSAEGFKIVAQEFIDVYKRFNNLN